MSFTEEELEQLKGFELNCDDWTSDKGGKTYLSWSKAWGEFKKIHPLGTFEIIYNESNGLPLFGHPTIGYFVKTTVTVGNITHGMLLPVLDNRMKVEFAPDIYLVNKANLRCLTKNLAMYGVGLNIYQGEDFPEDSEEKEEEDSMTQEEQEVHNIKLKAIEMIVSLDETYDDKKANLYDMSVDELRELYTKLNNK